MSTLASPSPLRPLDAQITGLAHDSYCRPSHLPPHLNLTNLIQLCFFLFRVPFSCPCPFCPGPGSHSRELFFHFKAKCFHEQRQRDRALFTCCCCHLPPQFKSFCGGYPRSMNSPRPCWYHTHSQQLLDPNLHVPLLEDAILLEKREPYLALRPSCYFFRSQVLDSGSQIDSQHFHTVCHRSSSFVALTQLKPHDTIILLFLSFPFSLTGSLRHFSQLLLLASSSRSLPFQPLPCSLPPKIL